MNHFHAFRGHQGNCDHYVAVLTLRNLLQILPAEDPSTPPELRAQRRLEEARAHQIADHIALPDYTLPAITISSSRIAFHVDGQISIPEDATVHCNDGQHRRRAIEIAIQEHPERADDTITVIFYEDVNLASMQQRFADLNSGQPAARSVKLLYDLRRPSKGRDASLKPPFAGLVEMQAANAPANSGKLWTLSGLDKTKDIDKTAFWTELLASWPVIADLHEDKIPAQDVRKNFIWAHNVAIQGIGLCASQLEPKDLTTIDWSRANPEWENRAQAAGRMLPAKRNAVLIANLILAKAGRPLPPAFAKVEEKALASDGKTFKTAKPTPLPTIQAKAPSIIQPQMKLDLGPWAHLYASGPFAYGEVPSFAGISGGRTSAMMAALLDPRVHLCFENTGLEDVRTLEFLLRLADALKREITWLEWRPPKRKGAPPKEFGFAIVDFATCVKHDPKDPMAAGVLFEGMLDALAAYRATKGMDPVAPHHGLRICTAYLKHRVQRAYMASLGIGIEDDQVQYIGLRADEPDRLARIKSAETSARTYATPLAEAGIGKPDVLAFWARQSFDLELDHDRDGNCGACLAGETEVVTSTGIRPIRELAGKTVDLLVPKIANGALSEIGSFKSAPVRSFGVQQLWKVVLGGHGRATKTVFATAEHRWFTVYRHTWQRIRRDVMRSFVETQHLKVGDRLRNLAISPIGEKRGGLSRIGAMHGFVFGDGTKASGRRPASIGIFEGKDDVFLPLFTTCFGEGVVIPSKHTKKAMRFYGMPRAWKKYPDITESRHYLIGFLSGWFAADGCVSTLGACILSSASIEHLHFARSLCAILGIRCSPIVTQTRRVKPPGGVARSHAIHRVSLDRQHLISDFFWLAHHRERAERANENERRRYGWQVISVEPTDRVEEVFCATVKDVGAFGLSDNLMTGNCFEKDDADLSRLLGQPDADAQWWIHIQKKYPGFGGHSKRPYVELLQERDTRLVIEAALKEGKEPEDDGRLDPKRFKLVVRNEKSYMAKEGKAMSCACEASWKIGLDEEGDAA